MKRYYLSNANKYNHGCTNSAVYEDNGDGTATCINAESCHSCWQVGHDQNHVYAEVGEVKKVSDLLTDRDLEPEEE